jgi:hypothetical protein
MAPKKKPAAQRRVYRMSILLTRDELLQIEKVAEAANTSVSAWARARLFEDARPPATPVP